MKSILIQHSTLLACSLAVALAATPTEGTAQFATAGGEIRAYPVAKLGSQWRPAMAKLNDGGFVLTWQDDNSAPKFRIYDPSGVPRSNEIETDTAPHVGSIHDSPAVVALSDGGFMVIWQAYINMTSVYDIYARAFNPNGFPLGDEFMVNTVTDEAQVRPTAALLDDGSILIAWQHDTGAHTDIHYRIYNASLAATGPVRFANQTTANKQRRPKAASLTNGQVAVVWESETGNLDLTYDSYVRLFDSSGALGNEVMVNSHTPLNQASPDVAAVPGGGAVVAWESGGQDGDSTGVYVRRFFNNTATHTLEPVGIETQINTTTTGSQVEPRLTSWNTGFLATWTSQNTNRYSGDDDRPTGEDGDGAGVFARVYSHNLVPQGDPIQINETTVNHQSGGVPLSLSPGRIVVAWSSTEDEDYVNGTQPFYYDDVFFRLLLDDTLLPQGPGLPGASPPPAMQVTSSAVTRFNIRNGKAFPQTRKYHVSNVGGAPLAWRIAGKPPRWLKASPSSGLLAPQAGKKVTLRIVPKRLPKKRSVQTRIKFDALDAGTGDTTRTVVVKNPQR